jgi:3-dehydroquinate synthase
MSYLGVSRRKTNHLAGSTARGCDFKTYARQKPSSLVEGSAQGCVIYHQRLSIHFDFPVCFTRDVFAPSNRTLVSTITRREPTRRHRLLFLVDRGVANATPNLLGKIRSYAEAHEASMDLVTPPVTIKGGEECKNDPQLVHDLIHLIHGHVIDRQSFVVAIGGGSMLDVVGYAAAIAHRGLRLIRLPTTVLAQNDSGIGIKNGVNAFSSKNYLGTFSPPFAVTNDVHFLRTLEPRDKRAGMAEAVKVALIRDKDFFLRLESQIDALAAFDETAVEALVRDCALLHMRHIASCGDPFETGSARPLDFGHWAAHKLESMTDYELRHGEAVALGIALDSRYSVEIGLLDERAQLRIQAMLSRLGFWLWHRQMEARGTDGSYSLLKGLAEFREHLGGELTITLLKELGQGIEVHEIDSEAMLRSLAWLRHQQAPDQVGMGIGFERIHGT